MYKKISLIILMLAGLAGCASSAAVKAPCTYNNRAACGAVVPLQLPNMNTI